MDSKISIIIEYDTQDKVNGLGMMIGQYLEQNLEEFETKVKQGLKLHITTSVEVEKGIATTIQFSGDRIFIKNNVGADAHLHLKSSYMALAKVLTGEVNPAAGVFSGEIKIIKFPLVKPFQALRLLRFLKIPEELLVNKTGAKTPVFRRERIMMFSAGAACGFCVAYLVFHTGLL